MYLALKTKGQREQYLICRTERQASEWLLSTLNGDYTVFNNGVSQVCLTKINLE